jgi:putative phage-type endonuclease
MIIIDTIEQGTPEWLALKAGKPSTSNFDKIIKNDGKPSKQSTKYAYQLLGEKLLGYIPETYTNRAMERGNELEAEAREFYQFTNDVEVNQVAVVYKDEEKDFLASPDGLVGNDGLVEIKCPLLPTHIEYLLKNELPAKYFQQVQGQLFVTDRKWVDFISYYPSIKPLIVRVERDEKFIQLLEVELSLFCKELKELEKKLNG